MKKLNKLIKTLLTLNLQDAAIKVAALQRLHPADENALGSNLSSIVERSIDALAEKIGVYSPTYLGHSDRADVGYVGSYAFSVSLDDGTPAVLKLVANNELAPYKKIQSMNFPEDFNIFPIIYDVKSFSELENFKSELTRDYEGYVIMEELYPLHDDIQELFKTHFVNSIDQKGREKISNEDMISEINEMLSTKQIAYKLGILGIENKNGLADVIFKMIKGFIRKSNPNFFQMDLERELNNFLTKNITASDVDENEIDSAVALLSKAILDFFIYGKLHDTGDDQYELSKLYRWPAYSKHIKPMDKLTKFIEYAYNNLHIKPADLHYQNIMTRADGSIVISDFGHFNFQNINNNNIIPTELYKDNKDLSDTKELNAPKEYFRNSNV